MRTLFAILKWRFGLSRAKARERTAYVPEYGMPDIHSIEEPDPNKIQLTWVGHSTFLIQVAGVNILTDPIWSERASPVSWAGPKRFARPGIRFEDLPKIDLVLISHTHYDHLDRPTILKLGNAPRYILQERTKWWFASEGITNASELSWWETEKRGAVAVTAVPAKHWSKRGLFRTNEAGWGGFVIESPAGIIYFAGDTGYHDEYFKEIGKRIPNIDLALIPIGAYFPRAIFGRFHVDPREAILVHTEVKAKTSIGMHWGVFELTQEPLSEPPRRLAEERSVLGISPQEFSVMKIGETRLL
ncbi:MAG TPA: MBL fold metallo-hydrolase [Candidatus Paceibacterota bacterium]|nr:MBL fold metallo-hydrolase [Candidatus Paceibacterota bacterium]